MVRKLSKLVCIVLMIAMLAIVMMNNSFAQKCELDTCNIKNPKCRSSYEFTIHKLNKLYNDLLNDGKKFLRGIDVYNDDEVLELYQYVYFGNSPDIDESRGNPIKWRVLATTANDYQNTPALFMVSEQAICVKNMKDMDNANKLLDKMLLDSYFTMQEQDSILQTSNLDNVMEQKLFLLSEKEVTSRKYGFWQGQNRNVLRTLKVIDEYGEEYNVEWWLRDVKNRRNKNVRSMVGEFGEITQRTYGEGAIRIALNIPFSQIICTHHARKAGCCEKISGKLDKINSNEVNQFKLTILDATRNNFAVEENEITAGAGELVQLKYSNATPKMSDKEEYISGVIKDKNGRELYYGKLEYVDTSGEGTVCVDIPNDIKQGEYRLIIMNEQENGIMQTNYAGYDVVNLKIIKR